jgi:prophage antirepressor-like protein
MSGLATIEREFMGMSVALIERDERLWMTGEQVARCLGYGEKRAVAKLADRHADEVEGHKGVVKLTTPGGAQDVTVYDEHALYVLAFHADTDKAKAFRAWLAETLRDIRTKDKILVDRQEWENHESALVAAMQLVDRMSGVNAAMASLASQIMHGRRKTLRFAEPVQREIQQRLFPAGGQFEEIATAEPEVPS